jgi:ATP-dependent Lhr-like helicase
VRCYVDCTIKRDSENPIDELPLELLQSLAVCSLLLEHWIEPPDPAQLDLSTLTHQVISSIAEAGALRAEDLHERLCVEGPFRACDTALFARLLRALGARDVIEQGPDGALILGLLGEKLRARQDFYAAFATPIEYTLLAGTRTLGTWPTSRLPKVGTHVVFAARRWLITDIDDERRKIHVSPSRRGGRPTFGGGPTMVHHRTIDRMLRLLSSDEPVPYADETARRSLEAARRIASNRGLARRGIVPLSDKSCLWLTWSGGAETRTYQALLAGEGIVAEDETIALACEASAERVEETLVRADASPPDLPRLAEHVQPKAHRKYDDLLPDDLLNEGIARELVWLPFLASSPRR